MSILNLNQARHNHSLADFLYSDGNYNDWVITTAYYACNHYVKYHLFPLEDHGVDGLGDPVENFDDYCRFSGSTDRHMALCHLCSEKVDEDLGADFRKLMDACKSARYTNYNVDPDMVEFAMTTLRAITERCSIRRATTKRPRKAVAVKKEIKR